ncbi:hypothetical protein TNCV_5101241 [Trichonephila clavipes]|nr:hypothetical protein TNCV_5101241 [Trichonephila clavipes]
MKGRRLRLPENVDQLDPQLEQILQEIPQERPPECLITLCHVVWLLASRLEVVMRDLYISNGLRFMNKIALFGRELPLVNEGGKCPISQKRDKMSFRRVTANEATSGLNEASVNEMTLRNEKVSNHGSIPITIDCNVVAFIVFEEQREQRQSRFGPIRRIYALLDDRFDELPNQTENKSLDSC